MNTAASPGPDKRDEPLLDFTRSQADLPAPKPAVCPIDLSDPAIYRAGQQYELWQRLREQSDVWLVEPEGDRPFWSVLSFELVSRGLTDHETFASSGGMRLGASPTATAATAGKMLAITDEPRHGKMRRVVSGAFTPRMVARLEQTMRRIAAQVVTDALEAGDCDIAEMAAVLPVAVICDLLGVPQSDWDYMLDRTKVAFGVGHEDGHSGTLAAQAHADLFRYYVQLMRRRRAEPQDDIVSALVNGSIDGMPLTNEEVVLNCDGLISGGNETTRHATIGGMLALVNNPDQWARMRQDPSVVPGAVQEILRYTTPAMHLVRTATRDVMLGNNPLRGGDQVAFWLGAANRDSARFESPLDFNIDRRADRHLTFAVGPHFCIGASLATAELNILFGEIVRRVGSAELVGTPTRIYSNLIDGFEHVPMKLAPLAVAGE